MTSTDASRRRVLITGASGGLGYELAKLFAADGWSLMLAARSGDKLQRVAAELAAAHRVDAQTTAIDLSQPGAAEHLFAACQQSGPLSALVNNAGFGTWGPFAESDPGTVTQMIQLNIATLTELTRLVLPDMLRARHGYVLNMASAAAFQPGPLMAVYFATKAYVLHFSEAIAEELAGTGVRVSALCPGPTETGFMHRAAMEESKLFQSGVMDAAWVARQGYEGLLHGRRIVVPGLKYRLTSTAVKFAARAGHQDRQSDAGPARVKSPGMPPAAFDSRWPAFLQCPAHGIRPGRATSMAKATYKDAGVDLEIYRQSMSRLPRLLHRTFSPRVMKLDGGFAGLFQLDFATGCLPAGMRNPVLVSCTDGVGTKLRWRNSPGGTTRSGSTWWR